MMDIISLVFMLAVCVYVVAPLFEKRKAATSRASETDTRMQELVHQQQMAAHTIEDLQFDLQTGKLSEEDFESLIADQRKIHTDADARLKNISGFTSAELTEKLEKEIAAAKSVMARGVEKICPSCSTLIQKGDKFCSGCGTKVS